MSDIARMTADDIQLVYFVINKYYKQYATDEDMIQVGAEAMCKCANKLGDKFSESSSYVVQAIRNEIVKEYNRRKTPLMVSLDDSYHNSTFDTDMLMYDCVPDKHSISEVFSLEEYGFTDEELEFAKYIMCGYTRTETRELMGISYHKMYKIVKSLKRKAGGKNGCCKRRCRKTGDEGTAGREPKVSCIQKCS